MIRATGSEHYAEYIPQIRAFVETFPLRTMFETDRLRLRSFRPSDGAFLYQMFTDPEVKRYIPPSPLPLTPERARRSADRRISIEVQHGFGLWIFREKDGGGFVGRGGLRRDILYGGALHVLYRRVATRGGRQRSSRSGRQ